MKNTLISFETAKLAKEKGFNWACSHIYNEFGNSASILRNKGRYHKNSNYDQWNDHVSAPTQSILQKWLREEHNIIVESTYDMESKKFFHAGYFSDNRDWTGFELYSSYEEALEVGLQQGLKLIQKDETT